MVWIGFRWLRIGSRCRHLYKRREISWLAEQLLPDFQKRSAPRRVPVVRPTTANANDRRKELGMWRHHKLSQTLSIAEFKHKENWLSAHRWSSEAVTETGIKFPSSYGTRMFVTVLTRARHWSISSARLIQSATSNLVQDPFKMANPFSWTLSEGSPVTHSSHLPSFVNQSNICWRVQNVISSFSLCSLLLPSAGPALRS